jgi:hypothetical protein
MLDGNPHRTTAAANYRGMVADHRPPYVLLGAGNRADLYFTALTGEYASAARLVAVCEPNRVRRDRYLARYADRLPAAAPPAACDPDHLGDLLRDHDPGTVVVTSPDWTHPRWVTAALDAGWRVVCEKPLAIDGCRAIAEAARRSPEELVVAFNYRLEVVERTDVPAGPPVVDPSARRDLAASRDPEDPVRRGTRLVLQRHWEPAREVPIQDDPSAHGGGDRLLVDDVFLGTAPDPLGR